MTAPTITQETLDHWRRLAEAATKGWRTIKRGNQSGTRYLFVADEKSRRVCEWGDGKAPVTASQEANAAFIAAAREAVPSLLALVAEQDDRIGRLEAALWTAREAALCCRQHLALFCGPDDKIARDIFSTVDAITNAARSALQQTESDAGEGGNG